MAVRKKPAASPAPLATTSSGGGPVVLLPGDLAARWHGTRAPAGVTPPAGWTWGKTGGPTTDYDRALAPEGFVQTARGGVGFVTVDDGRALVLDAELPTAWLPTDEGGVVVRGPDVDGSDAEAIRASVPEAGWIDVTTLVVGVPGTVVLFDAAFAGADDVVAIPSDPAPAVGNPGVGAYAVTRASVDTTDFIRLVRIDGPSTRGTTKKATTKKATTKKATTKKATTKKATTKKPATPLWRTTRVDSRRLPRPQRLGAAERIERQPLQQQLEPVSRRDDRFVVATEVAGGEDAGTEVGFQPLDDLLAHVLTASRVSRGRPRAQR
jgi:hypothetical protein